MRRCGRRSPTWCGSWKRDRRSRWGEAMTIGDVQTFLKSLAALLSAQQGAKPGGEFEAFAQGLAPFADWPIGTFAQFLRDADEYQRTGRVPVPAPAKKAAGGTRTTQKLAGAGDRTAIEAALGRLNALHDRFADETLTRSTIEG